LRAYNTYESIAEELGVTHSTIMKIVNDVKTGINAQIYKEWNTDNKQENHTPMKLLWYNIWNLSKQENELLDKRFFFYCFLHFTK